MFLNRDQMSQSDMKRDFQGDVQHAGEQISLYLEQKLKKTPNQIKMLGGHVEVVKLTVDGISDRRVRNEVKRVLKSKEDNGEAILCKSFKKIFLDIYSERAIEDDSRKRKAPKSTALK
mmetsp:Transcript_22343/g.29231  ORF Transcript_22343/g.29231 Transcript_22343/m.29231 type:complete len:118 (-) Transcript_22343:829-1182(-)